MINNNNEEDEVLVFPRDIDILVEKYGFTIPEREEIWDFNDLDKDDVIIV